MNEILCHCQCKKKKKRNSALLTYFLDWRTVPLRSGMKSKRASDSLLNSSQLGFSSKCHDLPYALVTYRLFFEIVSDRRIFEIIVNLFKACESSTSHVDAGRLSLSSWIFVSFSFFAREHEKRGARCRNVHE